ncbi:MAG: hypothetical protein DHS20C17_03220 [Cyclobacteriaceae bacterium]|nr:MAG: hypothetical protein DHS20C17_03220 [Cyclobacteriaceae bacterium]
MKKHQLIKFHLYCGLFTIFYLVAFGLSSLVLNHNLNLERSTVTEEWSSVVRVEQGLSNNDLAESVKNQLGLMGWTPYWKYKRDSVWFQFEVSHPGRNYQIKLELLQGDVQVSELPKGFLAVLHGLHFFNGNVPNAPFFLKTWAVYQWLTLLTMLISMIFGLWLWLKYRYRSWEGIAFGGVFMLTIILMILI